MRYRLTLECGASGLVDDVHYRHLLRQAVLYGYGRTRVRGGYVLILPAGKLVTLIAELR